MLCVQYKILVRVLIETFLTLNLRQYMKGEKNVSNL